VNKRRKELKKFVAFVILLPVIGAFAYRFHQAGKEVVVESIADVQAREGIPVEVALVEKADVEIWRFYSGTVEGIEQTAVVSNFPEEIVEITRQVGDPVSSGELLIRLAWRKSQVGYQQNLAAFENARKEVERLEALFHAGAVSEQQLDAARTQLRITRANLDAAVANLDITAPIGGVVVQRNVEVGDQVQPGAPLLVIADLSQAVVKLQVSGRDARRMRVGQPARLSPEEDPEQRRGTVHNIALSADPKSRLVEVELLFANPDGLLIPGTLVTAEVLLDHARGVNVVPQRAVIQEEEGATLWIIDSRGIAHPRKVKIGLINTAVVQVLQGVDIGERVVTSGANLLETGKKVKIVADPGKEG